MSCRLRDITFGGGGLVSDRAQNRSEAGSDLGENRSETIKGRRQHEHIQGTRQPHLLNVLNSIELYTAISSACLSVLAIRVVADGD